MGRGRGQERGKETSNEHLSPGVERIVSSSSNSDYDLVRSDSGDGLNSPCCPICTLLNQMMMMMMYYKYTVNKHICLLSAYYLISAYFLPVVKQCVINACAQ